MLLLDKIPVVTPTYSQEPWAHPGCPREQSQGLGALQDECLVPHWAEGLVHDLGAMDLVFGDEVFDHSLHPPPVVRVGWFLAPGLDAQQAVWVTEPCQGGGVGIPPGSSSCSSSHGTPTHLHLPLTSLPKIPLASFTVAFRQ